MVSNDAFRNAFLLSRLRNVPKAALSALEHLDKLAFLRGIERIEFAFPYPYGKVAQLNEQVGRKVDEMTAKYKTTVHLPMAPLHTEDGAMEVIAGLEYGLEHGTIQFVIHPAEVQRNRFWRKSTAFNFAKAKDIGLANLENILGDFKNQNIIIGIENLAGLVPYGKHPNDFDYLFGKRGQLTVGWCLDLCHLYNVLSAYGDYASTKLSIAALIDEYSQKDQLVEVHLTDTKITDGPDKHCALGFGNAPIDSILRKLHSFNGPVVAEVNLKDFEDSWNWLHMDR